MCRTQSCGFQHLCILASASIFAAYGLSVNIFAADYFSASTFAADNLIFVRTMPCSLCKRSGHNVRTCVRRQIDVINDLEARLAEEKALLATILDRQEEQQRQDAAAAERRRTTVTSAERRRTTETSEPIQEPPEPEAEQEA